MFIGKGFCGFALVHNAPGTEEVIANKKQLNPPGEQLSTISRKHSGVNLMIIPLSWMTAALEKQCGASVSLYGK